MLSQVKRIPPALWLVISAIALGLCFPPYGLKTLAYVALIPSAVVVLRAKSLLKMFVWAWLVWGLWWGVIGRWMIPVTFGGHIGLSLLMGLEIAIALCGAGLLARRRRWPMVLALPLCWTAMEVFRATFPFGGMNWFTLAQSQTPYQPGATSYVIQMADIFGWPVVTLYVAAWNGFLTDLCTRRIYADRVGRKRRMMPSIRWGLAGLTLLTVMTWTYGYARLEEAGRHQEPGPVVGIVQTNVPQNNKNRRTSATDMDMWEQLENGLKTVAASGAKPDWVLWPETSVPGPIDDEGRMYWQAKANLWRGLMPDDLELQGLQDASQAFGVEPNQVPSYLADWHQFRASLGQKVQQAARGYGVTLVAGVPAKLEYPDGRGVNRVVVVHEDGRIDPLVYDKVHRVPFGEYIPLVDAFPALKAWFIQTLTPYEHDYSLAPGEDLTIFLLPDGRGGLARAAAPVCFEDTVARLCRRMVYGRDAQTGKREKRVDVLINLTNDGWFESSAQGPQHLQLAAMRCVENRVPMLRAVNTGVSGMIDSSGRVVRVLSYAGKQQGVAATGVMPVTLDSRAGLFALLGMVPAWVFSGGVGLAVMLAFAGEIGRWVSNRRDVRAVKKTQQGDDALDA